VAARWLGQRESRRITRLKCSRAPDRGNTASRIERTYEPAWTSPSQARGIKTVPPRQAPRSRKTDRPHSQYHAPRFTGLTGYNLLVDTKGYRASRFMIEVLPILAARLWPHLAAISSSRHLPADWGAACHARQIRQIHQGVADIAAKEGRYALKQHRNKKWIDRRTNGGASRGARSASAHGRVQPW